MRVLDLAIVSKEPAFQKRLQNLSDFFQFSAKCYDNDEDFIMDSMSYKSISAIVVDCSYVNKPNEIAGLVQVSRQGGPESYIVAVASSRLLPEDIRIVKASGASIVVMETEIFSSSKMEFILTQVIRSAYIPIKTIDILPTTTLSFPLFHLMPVNGRFLKVSKPGTKISQDFLEKYKEVGELYLQRSDLPSWVEYSQAHRQKDAESALRECRLKFLQLSQSFLDLTLLVTDQSSAGSFSQGKELYAICEGFVFDLLQSLAHIEDPWDVVSNSAVGDFGSVERAPAIAAYSGMLSAISKLGDPKQVMLGALLSDLGYLDLSPSTTQKIRLGKISDLNAEELMEYHKHPIFSLNQCLSRKLPLSDNLKDMILQSHERSDQKGFPNRPRSEKVSEEAMLIRLCWELDRASQIRMGEARIPMDEIKTHLKSTVLHETGNFSISFALKIDKPLTTKKMGAVIMV